MGKSLACAFFTPAATYRIQAAFLVYEGEKTWNFCGVPRLVDVEDGPLRVPYIEGKIWGNSPCTKLKEGMSKKINFSQFPRGP